MKSPEPITTLVEFLTSSGARLRLFDMGRRVVRIPYDRFLRCEKNQLPYPAPLGQQAWLALLFQEPESSREPFAWFLRFPLDEQAKLSLAARDDFMHRLAERIGSRLDTANNGGRIETALADNPYSFKPREDRLAIFHARISRRLKKPASRFYDHALAYFRGELGWEQWSFVGYQGIADIAARLDQDDNERMLIDALPMLPSNPFGAICHCIENEKISSQLATALLGVTHTQLRLEAPSAAAVAASVRGVSRSRSATLRRQLIRDVLASPVAEQVEVLAAIGGRAWESLAEGSLAGAFLERLAHNREGQVFFDRCLSDLLFIPGMREPLLNALRSDHRSPALSAAVGGFFQRLGANNQ